MCKAFMATERCTMPGFTRAMARRPLSLTSGQPPSPSHVRSWQCSAKTSSTSPVMAVQKERSRTSSCLDAPKEPMKVGVAARGQRARRSSRNPGNEGARLPASSSRRSQSLKSRTQSCGQAAEKAAIVTSFARVPRRRSSRNLGSCGARLAMTSGARPRYWGSTKRRDSSRSGRPSPPPPWLSSLDAARELARPPVLLARPLARPTVPFAMSSSRSSPS
mmetsp:Transcript_93728/g.201169  ORF Transcript_93728/g.201169 Transcript_93728/m.201169 type:complete len:219 (-) Transcript_93728:564-1220(-)